MKALSVTFNASGAVIPLNYQYGVQSMIYGTLRASALQGEKWHDSSIDYGKRKYKFFFQFAPWK